MTSFGQVKLTLLPSCQKRNWGATYLYDIHMFLFSKTFVRVVLNLFFLSVVLGSTTTFAQIPSPSTWEHAATYNEGFFSPADFRILEGKKQKPSRLLVLDNRASDRILARLRLEDGSPVGRTVRSGPGPGRVSGRGMELSLFSDGGVLLWDGGNRRANVYSADLRFQGQVEGLENFSANHVALVNDSTLAVGLSVSASDLFKLYRLRRGPGSIRIAEEPLATIKTTEHPVLSRGPLDENFMLREGSGRRVGNELYFGYAFGSLVVGATETGLQWATTEPVNHVLPSYDFREQSTAGEKTRTTYTAPSVDEHPLGILDLAGDASHLYALYSGQNVDQTTNNRAAEVEATRHSNRLFVFDRVTGRFVKEMHLPIRARRIEVTSRHTVLLATEERDAPTFKVYQFPETEDTP